MTEMSMTECYIYNTTTTKRKKKEKKIKKKKKMVATPKLAKPPD